MADLSAVDTVVGSLAERLAPGSVLVLKSTVPVGTTRAVATRVRDRGIAVVSNPEFLRESHAIADFRHPDRILIGSDDDRAADTVRALYGAGPMIRTGPESAELAKYASNAFLALKISYTNSLARLCTRVGADIGEVTGCMGADPRIGPEFLQPGPGWGGSCLPKDTAALLHTGRGHGVELPEVAAARSTNVAQADRIIGAVSDALAGPLHGARITALGLTFKAGTCDLRDSPALAISAELGRRGALVTGYDPQLAMVDHQVLRHCAMATADDPYVAAKDAEAIIVFTEWPVFRELDWALIAQQAPGAVVLDTRNLLEPAVVRGAGLSYLGNGRVRGY